MSNPYFGSQKRQRELAKLERCEVKAARRAARKEAKADTHTGHVSNTDPTAGMADQQPPMLGSVARVLGKVH